MLALLLGGVTLVIAQASQPPVKAQGVTTSTGPVVMTDEACAACHDDVVKTWKTGLHAQAYTDKVFTDAWTAQGQPGACLVCHTTGYDPASGTSMAESVSCQSCHTPIPANHPTDKMPVDTSPDLCGKCHSDPRFSTENWKLSTHYQRDMTCSVCHDAHTAGMKVVAGTSTSTTDASDLCTNCHKDAMQNFPTSKHAEAGVTCVNCHLGFNVSGDTTSTASFSDVHKAPDHNFMPVLETCNKCHASQMHSPGEAAAAAAIKVEELGGTPTPQPTDVVTAIPPQTSSPLPVSPIGFATMAGLLGLAGGMVLAPWLERIYRHWNKKG
jgi:predicted CXXCH cytochrome family protein